jgi:protein SCO1/2
LKLAAVAATLAVACAGSWAAWTLTDGLRAFTTESARRLAVERAPRPLPQTTWQHGASLAPLGAPGPVRIVDFIYTRCPTVCQALGGIHGQLQRELADAIAQGRIELLSVGFDLEHDTPQALAAYRLRHRAGPGWHAAAPRGASELRALTDAFGVVVRPDGEGGFVHNAALSIVDARGRLAAVVDLEQWPAAAERARQLAAPSDVH